MRRCLKGRGKDSQDSRLPRSAPATASVSQWPPQAPTRRCVWMSASGRYPLLVITLEKCRRVGYRPEAVNVVREAASHSAYANATLVVARSHDTLQPFLSERPWPPSTHVRIMSGVIRAATCCPNFGWESAAGPAWSGTSDRVSRPQGNLATSCCQFGSGAPRISVESEVRFRPDADIKRSLTKLRSRNGF